MCYMAIALALVLFTLTATQCDRTQIHYLEKPGNMEKAEGQTATFTCVAINADLIYWKINGFAMSTKKFRNLAGDDVVLTDHPINKSVSISNLTVPANMAINGARVVCNLVQLGSSTITTSHVTLNVQGTFEPVHDITLENTSCTVLVKWSPPEHLPSIPPTNYNITIINTTSAEILDSDTLTTTNHTYAFHLDPEHLCSVLLIRIVAYNQWLSGQPAEIAWSLGGAVKPNSIGQQLRYFENLLRLTITFEVIGYCLDLLDTILLETICGNTTLTNVSSNASDVDTSGIVSGPHELSIDSLPEDERCSFRIVLNTTTGITTPRQPTMFDTFDIISVNFSVEGTTICIQCRFIPKSSAQGCQIFQLDFRSKIVDMFNISRINGVGSGCFNTEPGEYTLVAYDINVDTTLSKPYESTVVIVSTPPVPISTPAAEA